MGIGKRILSVLIGILFIISVSVLGGSLLAKQVLVKAIISRFLLCAQENGKTYDFYKTFVEII